MALVFAKRIRTIPVISQAEMLEMRYDTSIRPPLAIILLIAFIHYIRACQFINEGLHVVNNLEKKLEELETIQYKLEYNK